MAWMHPMDNYEWCRTRYMGHADDQNTRLNDDERSLKEMKLTIEDVIKNEGMMPSQWSPLPLLFLSLCNLTRVSKDGIDVRRCNRSMSTHYGRVANVHATTSIIGRVSLCALITNDRERFRISFGCLHDKDDNEMDTCMSMMLS